MKPGDSNVTKDLPGPYAAASDVPAYHSSLPPLPPRVINTEQWGRAQICFGKFRSRQWSYMDLLSLSDGEAQSYVKWCRARYSAAGGELKDLASFLYRFEMERSHSSLKTGEFVPGTGSLHAFK